MPDTTPRSTLLRRRHYAATVSITIRHATPLRFLLESLLVATHAYTPRRVLSPLPDLSALRHYAFTACQASALRCRFAEFDVRHTPPIHGAAAATCLIHTFDAVYFPRYIYACSILRRRCAYLPIFAFDAVLMVSPEVIYDAAAGCQATVILLCRRRYMAAAARCFDTFSLLPPPGAFRLRYYTPLLLTPPPCHCLPFADTYAYMPPPLDTRRVAAAITPPPCRCLLADTRICRDMILCYATRHDAAMLHSSAIRYLHALCALLPRAICAALMLCFSLSLSLCLPCAFIMRARLRD